MLPLMVDQGNVLSLEEDEMQGIARKKEEACERSWLDGTQVFVHISKLILPTFYLNF